MPVTTALIATAAYGAYNQKRTNDKLVRSNKNTIPSWLQNSAPGIIGGSGGMANLKDLLESRGEVDPAKRNFEFAQSARGQMLEDRAIRGSAGRSGQGRTGALTGAIVGSARNRSRRDVGIAARHTNEAEDRRRQDMGQLWQLMQMYLGQGNIKKQNQMNRIATGGANRAAIAQGLGQGIAGMGKGGGLGAGTGGGGAGGGGGGAG